jgi:hypothetical protein
MLNDFEGCCKIADLVIALPFQVDPQDTRRVMFIEAHHRGSIGFHAFLLLRSQGGPPPSVPGPVSCPRATG